MSIDWRHGLKTAYRTPAELLQAVGLAKHSLAADVIDSPFSLLVPQSFAERMVPEDANDPLLRQVLPLAAEERAGWIPLKRM